LKIKNARAQIYIKKDDKARGGIGAPSVTPDICAPFMKARD